MKYKLKTPKVDKKRRAKVAKMVKAFYKAAHEKPPFVLWAGNGGQWRHMQQACWGMQRFQERAKWLRGGGSKLATAIGLQPPTASQLGVSLIYNTQSKLHFHKWPWQMKSGFSQLPPADQALYNEVHAVEQFGELLVICLLPQAHTIMHPEQNRPILHCLNGPAVVWEDGTEEFWVQGVDMPKTPLLHPERLTAQKILQEGNQERRRVMTDIFTRERLIKEGGFELVQKDEYGTLWKSKEKYPRWRDDAANQWEATQIVEVINGTKEADGSQKHYFLQVPPTVDTAHAAVAWTYNLAPEQYNPLQRT